MVGLVVSAPKKCSQVHLVFFQDFSGHWSFPHVDLVVSMVRVLPPEGKFTFKETFDGLLRGSNQLVCRLDLFDFLWGGLASGPHPGKDARPT